jgi:hypothetical protein
MYVRIYLFILAKKEEAVNRQPAASFAAQQIEAYDIYSKTTPARHFNLWVQVGRIFCLSHYRYVYGTVRTNTVWPLSQSTLLQDPSYLKICVA